MPALRAGEGEGEGGDITVSVSLINPTLGAQVWLGGGYQLCSHVTTVNICWSVLSNLAEGCYGGRS